VVAGPAKKHILTEEERWLIAIHEASHAVVTEAAGPVDLDAQALDRRARAHSWAPPRTCSPTAIR
jgi:cell division protease FtsH